MSTARRKLPPAFIALLLQFSAFVLASVIWHLYDLAPEPLVFAVLCGILAALFSKLVGLARWWIHIQLAFAPALVLMLKLDIPPVFFLAAFLVMLVVYWTTFRTQVPLYLSSDKIWQALETQLPAAPFTFIDLGSGIGGVLTHLAQTHPHGRYHGVEAAPLPFLWSWLRIRFGGYRNCTVYWGSLWDSDLSQYDVVFAYLSPVPMAELWAKAEREMRPGSLFISNTFAVPERPPHETLTVEDLHRSTLYLWHMQGR